MSFGRIDLDPDLAPLTVFGFVRGVVSEDVLVPEFESDLVTDVFQLIGGVWEERLPAADLREIFNNGPAAQIGTEFSTWIDDSDNKNLNILFFHKLFDVRERVPAVVVLTIGDRNNAFLLFLALFIVSRPR